MRASRTLTLQSLGTLGPEPMKEETILALNQEVHEKGGMSEREQREYGQAERFSPTEEVRSLSHEGSPAQVSQRAQR